MESINHSAGLFYELRRRWWKSSPKMSENFTKWRVELLQLFLQITRQVFQYKFHCYKIKPNTNDNKNSITNRWIWCGSSHQWTSDWQFAENSNGSGGTQNILRVISIPTTLHPTVNDSFESGRVYIWLMSSRRTISVDSFQCSKFLKLMFDSV